MLIFGSQTAMRYCQSPIKIEKIYNFNTMYEMFPQLIYLNPYRNNQYPGNTNCMEFDAWYVNYISNTPEAFREFINLMRDVYNGKNVWVLVDWYETSYNVIETLAKYILEQYGYSCNMFYTPEDTENYEEGYFSPIGIQLFDSHLENYLHTFGDKGLENDTDD